MMQNSGGSAALAKPSVRNPILAQLLAIFMIWGMVSDLNKLTGGSRSPLALFVPMYNMWWLFSILPGEAAAAKLKAASKSSARGGFVYLLFPGYALASDLNDIAEGR